MCMTIGEKGNDFIVRMDKDNPDVTLLDRLSPLFEELSDEEADMFKIVYDSSSIEEMTFRTYLKEDLDISKIGEIQNTDTNKPDGGLWASPTAQSATATWEDAGVYELMEGCQVCDYKLKEDSNVLIINTVEDLNNVPSVTVDESGHYFMDFEGLVSLGYDAILVSMENSGGFEVDENSMYEALYGWDVTSLVVFNPDAIDLDSITYHEMSPEIREKVDEATTIATRFEEEEQQRKAENLEKYGADYAYEF